MGHVTFIHGIANKPPPDELLDSWEQALAYDGGIDLGTTGVTSEMIYWADVMYPEPASEGLEAAAEVPDAASTDVDLTFRGSVEGDEAGWVERFAGTLGIDDAAGDPDESPPEANIGPEFERIPLPRWLKRRMLETLLRDVHHYLFNAKHRPRPAIEYPVRDEIRARVMEALERGAKRPGPHIVISHSMGTVIAYDCLKRVPEAPPVDGLITVGSPLGRDEITDEFAPDWTRSEGFPVEKVRGRWVNVFDHFDPVVGVYPHLTHHFRRDGEEEVVDVNEQNWGKWRHDIAKYMRGPILRTHIGEMLELER